MREDGMRPVDGVAFLLSVPRVSEAWWARAASIVCDGGVFRRRLRPHGRCAGAVSKLSPNWWNAVCSRYPAETVGCGE